MKQLLTGLLLALACLSLQAHTATVKYRDNTQTVSIEDGHTLKVDVKCPSEVPCLLKVTRGYYETAHKRYLLAVGLSEFDPKMTEQRGSTACASAILACKSFLDLKCHAQGKHSLLTNRYATVSAVRSRIEEAASNLSAGDQMLMYFATPLVNADAAGIDIYDGNYTAQALADDLATFKSGVKIVVILDIPHATSVIPGYSRNIATAVLSSLERYRTANAIAADVVFMVGTSDDEPVISNYYGVNLFTSLLLNYGGSELQDTNMDGIISCYEAFKGTLCTMAEKFGMRETPYCSNLELARTIPLMTTLNTYSYGQVSWDGLYFRYVIPKLVNDVNIELDTMTAPPEGTFTFTKLAYQAQYDPLAGTCSPHKHSGTFVLPYSFSTEWEMTDKLNINGIQQTLGFIEKVNKSGTNCKGVIYDEYMIAIGKAQFKANAKKGTVTCKFNCTSKVPCPPTFQPQSGKQNAGAVLRDKTNIYVWNGVCDVKSNAKNGKITAKISK